MNGFRLGRVAGIDVYLDWSLLIIVVLITTTLGLGVFPSWHPDWSPATVWVTAFAAAILFIASVFIHELSHALVGRAKGIEIKRITLFIFGGMAHLEREPHAWRAELWMAIVGPFTSLILGVLFLVVGGLVAGDASVDPEHPQRMLSELGPAATLFFWLGPVNIILGIFNLVPGFPLDGGRVLRAIMWGITGDLRSATRWASVAGQAFAWFLIVNGFAMIFGMQVPIFGSGLVNGLWLAFIGWFLNNAALMSYRQLLVRESLEDVPITRLMKTDLSVVDPRMTIEMLVEKYLLHSDQRAYPVMDGERFLGLVSLSDVRKVEREKWSGTEVREVFTPLSELVHIGPDGDAADALLLLSRHGLNQLPVLEGERFRGLIRREDILKWLSLRGGDGTELLNRGRSV